MSDLTVGIKHGCRPMYSNEAAELTKTFDDFKLKKPFGLHSLHKNISSLQGLTRLDTKIR